MLTECCDGCAAWFTGKRTEPTPKQTLHMPTAVVRKQPGGAGPQPIQGEDMIEQSAYMHAVAGRDRA
jgi:hypothetical protein